MNDKFTPLNILAACFAVSSLAGLASLLRSGKVLNARAIASAVLYSGIFGLIIGLILFNSYGGDNFFVLIGVSGLAGLGGSSLLDFAVQVISKGGLHITIESDGKDENKDKGTKKGK